MYNSYIGRTRARYTVVMYTGMILLIWIEMAVLLALGLMVGGMVAIRIDKVEPDEED